MNLFYKIFKRNKKPISNAFDTDFSFENAIKHYNRIGVNITTGATEEDIQNIQYQLSFTFPKDFKEFHSICNGFAEWDMDNYFFSIWTFDRIIEEYDNKKEEEYDFIPICDYLINSNWYGYIRDRNGIFNDYDRK